jgi:hypothetical protein
LELFKQVKVWHKRGLAGVVGAIAGFAYYYYVGCNSGTCAITSNPYISTIYGTVLAILLVPSEPKKEKNGNNNTTTDQEV